MQQKARQTQRPQSRLPAALAPLTMILQPNLPVRAQREATKGPKSGFPAALAFGNDFATYFSLAFRGANCAQRKGSMAGYLRPLRFAKILQPFDRNSKMQTKRAPNAGAAERASCGPCAFDKFATLAFFTDFGPNRFVPARSSATASQGSRQAQGHPGHSLNKTKIMML